jgi:hypothetical protein
MVNDLVRFGEQVFKFEDIKKQSRLIQSIQSRIDRELYCDEKGGLVKLGHNLFFQMKKAAGLNVKSLEELFSSEKHVVSNLKQYLVSLHDICEVHYNKLADFQDRNESKIKECIVTSPTDAKKRRELVREYHEVAAKLHATKRSNPAYCDLRNRFRSLDKEISDVTGNLDVKIGNYAIRNHMLDKVDSNLSVLVFGKNNVKVIAAKYELAEEYLEDVIESVNFTSNFWKHAEDLYSLNEGISQHLGLAGNLEVRLLDARVRDMAPNSTFSDDDRVIDVLDDINAKYNAEGLRYLTR